MLEDTIVFQTADEPPKRYMVSKSKVVSECKPLAALLDEEATNIIFMDANIDSFVSMLQNDSHKLTSSDEIARVYFLALKYGCETMILQIIKQAQNENHYITDAVLKLVSKPCQEMRKFILDNLPYRCCCYASMQKVMNFVTPAEVVEQSLVSYCMQQTNITTVERAQLLANIQWRTISKQELRSCMHSEAVQQSIHYAIYVQAIEAMLNVEEFYKYPLRLNIINANVQAMEKDWLKSNYLGFSMFELSVKQLQLVPFEAACYVDFHFEQDVRPIALEFGTITCRSGYFKQLPWKCFNLDTATCIASGECPSTQAAVFGTNQPSKNWRLEFAPQTEYTPTSIVIALACFSTVEE
jgi:hypothetical protein